MLSYVFLYGHVAAGVSADFLKPLPRDFQRAAGSWAWLSYDVPAFAVLPGQFNRSVFAAPGEATATDLGVKALYVVDEILLPFTSSGSPADWPRQYRNAQLNETDFVAYDRRFFDFIGSDATVKKILELSHQTHEASCWVPGTKDILFAEWGPPGGNNGQHDYQYILDTESHELRNVTTNPPTLNVHGCVAYDGALYVVTDGGPGETAYFAKIDPKTWKRTTLLNHYYEQPFGAFNDLEVDKSGNFYLTDSKSGFVSF